MLSVFYYGVRCVISHGNASKTLDYGGVLYKWEELFEQCCNSKTFSDNESVSMVVQEYFVSLLGRVREYKREFHISYSLPVNCIEFFEALSMHLANWTAGWIDRTFGIQLWEYCNDPRLIPSSRAHGNNSNEENEDEMDCLKNSTVNLDIFE